MTVELGDRLREYWDADADTYANTHEIDSPAARAAWRAALLNLLPPPPASVLDVGAGTGVLSLLLGELGYEVTALDFSPKMLEHLQHKAHERGIDVTLVNASADDPPTGPFDVVTTRLLLWMLVDPVTTMRKWREVAPNGKLAIFEATWGSADPVEARKQRIWSVLAKLKRIHHYHHPTDDPAIKRLFSSGSIPHDVCGAVDASGWPHGRLERLRDVEWAEKLMMAPLERPFGVPPWYAVTAGDA